MSGGANVKGSSKSEIGVLGLSDTNYGVEGDSNSSDGVFGMGGKNGVHGESNSGNGVYAHSASGVGLHAESTQQDAIQGVCSSTQGHAGVSGTCTASGFGVWASSTSGDAIFGRGGKNGVHGETASPTDSGVWGNNTSPAPPFPSLPTGYGVAGTSTNGIGVFGQGKFKAAWFSGDVYTLGNLDLLGNVGISGAGTAGNLTVQRNINAQGDMNITGKGTFGADMQVAGTVTVNGDILLPGKDCAEGFDIADSRDTINPGTVVVMDSNGKMRECTAAYDKTVAGVISGAGDNKPGIILGRRNRQESKMPLALIGSVFCKVDASYGAIQVGDLLTTSATPGHAMKAFDSSKAFGSVIGKALRPLQSGQGLIPILIALQ